MLNDQIIQQQQFHITHIIYKFTLFELVQCAIYDVFKQ
jgi:hypothetical protein